MKRYLTLCVALTVLAAAAMVHAGSPGVVFPSYYPEEFSGVGLIDRFAEKQIVINDQQYILSSRITYHTLNEEYAYRSAFGPGMLVGYITGSENEIVSIWFIKK